jgi:uncharacterized C2H2 Zn-finger protein
MKHFKINSDGLFICEECQEVFKNLNTLSRHINSKHKSSKEYYDKWLKEREDDLCKTCLSKTQWNQKNVLSHGYNKYCSKKCLSSHMIKNITADSRIKAKKLV